MADKTLTQSEGFVVRVISAVDRALKKVVEPSYENDAEAIAKVMVRHYGDEADAVLKLAIERLRDVRRTKR